MSLLDRATLDAALIFFTQAYVFALDAGLAEADDVGRILRANGRL